MEDTKSLYFTLKPVNLDQCSLTYPTIPKFMPSQLPILKNLHGELTARHKMSSKENILDHVWEISSVLTSWKTVKKSIFLNKLWTNNFLSSETKLTKAMYCNGVTCPSKTIKLANIWPQERELPLSTEFLICLNCEKKEDKQFLIEKTLIAEQSTCIH